MKTILLYVAEDGREFPTENECLEYEAAGCVSFSALPGYGEHVPISQSSLQWMLSGDGSCYYATATHRSDKHAHAAAHPTWATHLIYFGK